MADRFQCPSDWTVQQRLDHYTIPEAITGCHLCWASPNPNGYPTLRISGRTRLATRMAWEIANGQPVPKGVVIRHRCDNPGCVNPDHLLAGSQLDNVADMVRRKRQAVGEKHSQAKLTADVVRAIYQTPGLHEDIAKLFHVSRTAVGHIKRGDRWAHTTGHKGHVHRKPKLTAEKALELYNATGTPREISSRFGVSLPNVYTIKSRRTWRHIHEPPARS